MIRFAEKLQVVPLRAPIASTSSFNTAFVKVQNNHWITFLVQWGALAGASTSTYTLRPRSTTSAAGTTAAGDTALPFKYRLSNAVGDDQWGAVVARTNAQTFVYNESQTPNRLLMIEIDPSDIPGLQADATHVYLECVAVGDGATDENTMSVVAVLEPRYPQNSQLSSS